MSLVNIVMDQERALIATDTKAQFMNTSSRSISEATKQATEDGYASSKFDYLPHANVIVTSRGVALLGNIIYSQLKTSGVSSFDVLVESMPECLTVAYNYAISVLKQQGVTDAFAGSEITLVGYSIALSRMEAVRWVRQPDDTGFRASPVGSVSLMPDAEWPQSPEPPSTDEAMEAIARDQVQYCIDRWPDGEYRLGGRLLLAELTRDCLTVRTIADLDA